MRVIETKNGSRAVWMPNYRSRRYALVAGLTMGPALAAAVGLLLELPSATGAALAVLVVIIAAAPVLMLARGNALSITADLVVAGTARTPASRIRRADVVLVRHRGEFGELMGPDERVLLPIPGLLTPQQVKEVADYLHVPFSGAPAAARVAPVEDSIPGAFVLRPDPGKTRMLGLIAGLFVLLGIGVGVWTAVDIKRSTGIFLILAYSVFAVIGTRWHRANGLVVTEDTVFKGARDRSKFVARAEIADVVYGQRLALRAANKSTLLSLDVSFFTQAQAKDLADRLGVPLHVTRKPRKQTTQAT